MEFVQTYETTVASPDNGLSATVMVIPSRSLPQHWLAESKIYGIAEGLLGVKVDHVLPNPYIEPSEFASILLPGDSSVNREEAVQFATYVVNARIIPFESSPIGAEALASIAAASVKAGTISIGVAVGYIAGGPTPFLLITVPLGIILCGASVSFARWAEENRDKIWKKLLKLT